MRGGAGYELPTKTFKKTRELAEVKRTFLTKFFKQERRTLNHFADISILPTRRKFQHTDFNSSSTRPTQEIFQNEQAADTFKSSAKVSLLFFVKSHFRIFKNVSEKINLNLRTESPKPRQIFHVFFTFIYNFSEK